MKKETKVEKIETKIEYFCDGCSDGTESEYHCVGCHRDICEKHSKHINFIWGCHESLCPDCFEEYKPFKEKADELHKQSCKLIDDFMKLCEEKYGVKE
jgi:hypothetical protein